MNIAKCYVWTKEEPLLIMAKAEMLTSRELSKVENLGYIYINKGDMLQVLHSKEEDKGKGKFYVKVEQDEGMLEKELTDEELNGIQMQEFDLKDYKDNYKIQKQKLNKLINSWIKDLEYKNKRIEMDAKRLIRKLNKQSSWNALSFQ